MNGPKEKPMVLLIFFPEVLPIWAGGEIESEEP